MRPPLSLPSSLGDFAGGGGSCCVVRGVLLFCAETHFKRKAVSSVGQRVCWEEGFLARSPRHPVPHLAVLFPGVIATSVVLLSGREDVVCDESLTLVVPTKL